MNFCLDKNNPDVKNLMERYGEDQANAMAVAAIIKFSPVYIPVNGKQVESKLFKDILEFRSNNYEAAFDEYMTYLNDTPEGVGLDNNGEPEYRLVDPITERLVTPAELDERRMADINVLSSRLADKVEALRERITNSINKRKQSIESSKFFKAMDKYADDASKLNMLEFLFYTNGYTYYMNEKLTRSYVNKAIAGKDILEDIDSFRTFLALTEEITDIESLAETDPKTREFFKEEKLLDTLQGVTGRRESLRRTMENVARDYSIYALAQNSERMREQFKEERRAAFRKENMFGRDLSKAQIKNLNEQMEKQVAEEVEQNRERIFQMELDRARKIVTATQETNSAFHSWMYDAHSINDDVIQYLAQEVEKVQTDIRQTADAKMREMIPTFKEFDKATKRRKTVEKKYDEIIEDRIQLDENGNPVLDKNGNLKIEKGKKSRYMTSKYYSQFKEIYKAKEDKILNAQTDVTPNDEALDKAQEEFDTWLEENTVLNKATGKREPNSRWLNPQYDKLQTLKESNSAIYKMYDFLTSTQQEADNFLPIGSMAIGLKIPQLEKDFYEKTETQGAWQAAKLAFQQFTTVRSDETDVGIVEGVNVMERFNKALLEAGVKRIPLHYRYNVELDNLSYDLASSVMMNYYNSVNFAKKTQIKAEAEVLKNVVGTRTILDNKGTVRPYRKGDEKDPYVQVYTDEEGNKYTKRFYAKKQGKEGEVYKAMESYIEDNIYGKAVEGNPALVKAADNLIGYTGSLMLGANLVSGARNFLNGNIQNFIEASAGDVISGKDIATGWGLYLGDEGYMNIINLMGDVGRVKPKAKTNLLIEKYNALSEWNVMDRKFANNSFIRRHLRKSRISFANSMPEHFIQTTLMYAVLNTYEVEGKGGKKYKLWDAYEVKDGELIPKEGVTIPDELNFEVGQKIRDVNKRTQGNYNPDTKAMIQRYIGGRLFIMFRKWMGSGFARRYRGLTWETFKDPTANLNENRYFNKNTGKFEEGIYFTLYRYMRGLFADMKKYGWDTKNYQLRNWNSLSAEDRANIRRGVTGASITSLIWGLAAMSLANYESAGDDEEERRKWAWRAYFLGSIKSELQFFTNPNDTLRLLKNPSAVINPLQKALDLGTLILTGEFGEYEAGRLAGQNKIWYKASDMIPIYRGAFKFDPEFANQFVFR